MNKEDLFLASVSEVWDRREPDTTCLMLLMEEYRPDLARFIANRFELEFFDFREEVMSGYGWQAHSLSFHDLESAIKARTQESGIVLFNVEALLSSRLPEERENWLQRIAVGSYNNPLFVPLVLYTDAIGNDTRNAVDLRSYELPDQSLISRLAM